MTVRERLRRPSSLLLILGASVAALGAFNLAWYVPSSSGPVMSMSYAVGYNNVVAWVAVLLACAICVAAGRLARRERGSPPAEEAGAAEREGAGVPRADTLVLAVLTALAFGVFAVATYGIPVFDNGYFFLRIAQTLGGAVPWRDFEFPYGPLMLYAPAALAWLSARLGADPVLGYYVALGVSHVAGVPLLAWVVGRLPIARARRRAMFWIIGSYALLGVMGGLNYTLARFLAPVASVLVLAAWMRRDTPLPSAALGAASLGLAVLNAAVSPELGVAYAVASTAMLAGGGGLKDPGRRTALAVQVAGLAAAALAFGRIVFAAVALRAGGALAMPVLPSPYVLLFIGTVLAVSYAVGLGTLSLSGTAPGAALAVLGLLLVPSALGRADHGHVFWNAVPVLLAGAMVIGAKSARRFWLWAGALAVAFSAWVGVYDTMAVPTAYRASTRERPSAGDVERLLGLDRVAMPFGGADTLGFEYAERGTLVVTSSDDNGPLDEAQMDRVAQDLERADRIVMPTGVAQVVSSLMTSADAPVSRMPAYAGRPWTLVLQFPVRLKVVRRQYDGAAVLGAHIVERFEPVSEVGSYVVLERRR